MTEQNKKLPKQAFDPFR